MKAGVEVWGIFSNTRLDQGSQFVVIVEYSKILSIESISVYIVIFKQ